MINLIPNQEKKKKVKDFYFRLTVIFLFVLSFCFLIATVAILPAYFLSSVKKNLAENKLETQNAEVVPLLDQNTSLVIEDLNNKLTLIEEAQKNKYLVSAKVINEVVLKKMYDIKITSIFYESNEMGEKKVNINGIASSRERLLLFRRALENDTAFKKVDLPISNFVKGTNIRFFLTLTPS